MQKAEVEDMIEQETEDILTKADDLPKNGSKKHLNATQQANIFIELDDLPMNEHKQNWTIMKLDSLFENGFKRSSIYV